MITKINQRYAQRQEQSKKLTVDIRKQTDHINLSDFSRS